MAVCTLRGRAWQINTRPNRDVARATCLLVATFVVYGSLPVRAANISRAGEREERRRRRGKKRECPLRPATFLLREKCSRGEKREFIVRGRATIFRENVNGIPSLQELRTRKGGEGNSLPRTTVSFYTCAGNLR